MRALALVAALPLLVACSGSLSEPAPEERAPAPVDPQPTLTPTPSELGRGPQEVPQGSFTGARDGCSNLLAYRSSSDGTQFAVVTIDRELLHLELGAARTVDLGTTPAGVSVFVDVFANAVEGQSPYCAHARTEELALTRWTAQAGTLTIELAEDSESTDPTRPTYRATLRLEKVHLVGPDGGFAVVVPSVVIDDVRVGWLPK
jgi:hypothetical protein